jgi:hypothetical protein
MAEERSKTRAFLSSHKVRMTSMMKEFAVFLSEDANRATAAGHHSPISAFPEGTMLGRLRHITTPVQMAVANGHWSVM